MRTAVYWVLGGTALAAIGYYSYQYLQLPNAVYVKTIKAKLQNGKVITTISIYNATSADVTVKSLHLDILIYDRNILDGMVESETVIKSGKTVDMVLEISPNWIDIGLLILNDGTQILNDLQNWDISHLDLQVKGNIFLTKANLRIPFQKTLLKDESK